MVCIGLPPKDILDDVARSWLSRGHDVHACMEAAASITSEWEYERRSVDGRSPSACINVFDRLKRKKISARCVPVQLRTLEQLLRPQPLMADVVDRLLDWIDAENDAMRAGQPQPAFKTRSGESIFPDSEECGAPVWQDQDDI